MTEAPRETTDLWTPHVGASTYESLEHGLQNASIERGTILYLGRIGSLIANPSAEWSGPLSVDARIEAGEFEASDVEEFIGSLERDYRPTTEGALMRCIDDRSDVGFVDTVPNRVRQKLGPQTAGGTIGGAVTLRSAKSASPEEFSEASIVEDITVFGHSNLDSGFTPADHVDNLDKPEGSLKIGCADVDEQQSSMQRFNLNNVITIADFTKQLLRGSFREDSFMRGYANAMLLAKTPSYFATVADQLAALRALHNGALPEKDGVHNGVVVVANEIDDTTLQTNAVNARTDGEMMAFGYDLWFPRRMAKAHFPDDPFHQSIYQHNRTARLVATLMQVSNGDLRVAHRIPREA